MINFSSRSLTFLAESHGACKMKIRLNFTKPRLATVAQSEDEHKDISIAIMITLEAFVFKRRLYYIFSQFTSFFFDFVKLNGKVTTLNQSYKHKNCNLFFKFPKF